MPTMPKMPALRTMPKSPMVRQSRPLSQPLGVLLGLLLGGLQAADSLGQVQVGQVGQSPELPGDRRTQLETAKNEARWNWGNTRLQPIFAIRETAWVQNAFDQPDEQTAQQPIDDFTTTAAAGLTFFQEIGSATTFSAWALPAYVWWQDLEDRRRLNGDYGVGLYTGGSRVELDLQARRLDQQALVTPEVRELTSLRNDQAEATIRVELYRSIRLFANATTQEIANLIEGGDLGTFAEFDRLNRTEDAFLLGLEANVLDRAQVRIGVFDLDVDFEDDLAATLPFGAIDRDFEGQGWFAEVDVPNDRLSFSSRLESRELSPGPGSIFPETEELLGFARLTLDSVDERRSADLYQRRQIFNALGAQFAWTLENIVGGRISLRIADRHRFSAFAEFGELDFEPLTGFQGARSDDLTRIGATWAVELPYGIDFLVQYLDNAVESQFPEQDRSTEAVSISIGLRDFAWP